MKEYSLYSPGHLVKCREDIHSVASMTGAGMSVPVGTVGMILQGPTSEYNQHCQVWFVAMAEPWWVNFDEIEPHIDNMKKYIAKEG